MNKKSRFYNALTAPYGIWMALFIVIPLGIVAGFAFTGANGSFSLENIKLLSRYTDTISRSVYFGLIATLVSFIVAYPLAWILSQAKMRTQSILILLIMLPMWMNFILRTYSIMVLFEDTGIINNALVSMGLKPIRLINTKGAVIFGMVYNYLPFMILPLYSTMSKLDNQYIEAAKDLGANWFQILKEVLLPLTKPGIVSGITMVFVPSVSTFYISQKLGGGRYTLIGDVIEMQFQTAYNYHLGASISLLLMILILLSLAIMNRMEGSEEGGES